MLILDHIYFRDQEFGLLEELKKHLPEVMFKSKEMDHPNAKTRFMHVRNTYLEFVHETTEHTRGQGISFGTEGDLFEFGEKIPQNLKEKYNIDVFHRNENWRKHVDEDGDPIRLRKSDDRIEEQGWDFLLADKIIDKFLNVWITKYCYPGFYERRRNEKPKVIPDITLVEVWVSSKLYEDEFFQYCSKDISEPKVLETPDSNKYINKLVFKTDKTIYDSILVEEIDDCKVISGGDEFQADFVFRS